VAFRETLNGLVGASQPHPILEDLLLFRAQLALAERRYNDAEADASTLLEQFPGSSLRASALGVLMSSAWERGQFRRAADFAARARAETRDATVRAPLGVIVAEAHFRALDYRSAADAYAVALENPPAGVPPGGLMFQRVHSEIAAGRLEEASLLLDSLAQDARFDLVSRWQAEWNLARALQTAGKEGVGAAYERINRLLGGGEGARLPADLAVRMSWLQARLAFDRGEPARSLELVTSLRGGLAELDAELRAEVASSLALLEAQANFALGRPDAALAVLQQLRADYPQADAAVFSYVVEAEAYVAQGRLVDAQRVFVKLADDFPGNRFAPYGLLQAALTVRRLGQDSNRREAYNILERLVQNYPGSDLIFAARFAQGDLLRELNQFANALQIYERLVIDFPRHGDVRAAELAVADCQAALAATDPARLENAIAGYERLQFLPTAAPDLRMEAGFKHGYALARSGKRARAQEVWWPLAEPFTAGEATSPRLGTGGRYWLARVLLELGLLHEREARFEQARDMFGLILRLGLPRGDEARGALARLGAGGVTP
jgi:TolA-binding protein